MTVTMFMKGFASGHTSIISVLGSLIAKEEEIEMGSDVALFVDHFVTRREDGTYVLTRQPEEMEMALMKLLLKYYLKGDRWLYGDG